MKINAEKIRKCQPIIWVSERTWGQIIEHEKEKILLEDLWNKILCALRGEPYKKEN